MIGGRGPIARCSLHATAASTTVTAVAHVRSAVARIRSVWRLPLLRRHLAAADERQYDEYCRELPRLDLADIAGGTGAPTHEASIAWLRGMPK